LYPSSNQGFLGLKTGKVLLWASMKDFQAPGLQNIKKKFRGGAAFFPHSHRALKVIKKLPGTYKTEGLQSITAYNYQNKIQ
jgi:hypothetical protein